MASSTITPPAGFELETPSGVSPSGPSNHQGEQTNQPNQSQSGVIPPAGFELETPNQADQSVSDSSGNPFPYSLVSPVTSVIGSLPGISKAAYDWAVAQPAHATTLYKLAQEFRLSPKDLKNILHIVASAGGS